MSKLVYYELKKAIFTRFFLLAFCAAALLNFLLQCGIQDYQNYLDGIRYSGEAAPDHVESFFDYMAVERSMAHYLDKRDKTVSAMSKEEHTVTLLALEEKYGENVREDYFDFMMERPEMQEIPGCLTEISDLDYLDCIHEMEAHNSSVNQKLEDVLKSAEIFLLEAEADGNQYEIHRNKEIMRLYALPREKISSNVRKSGEALFGSPTMVFVYLLILLITATSVAGEQDRRTWLLLHTARDGKGKTLLAKFISGWIAGIGLTLILQLVSLLSFFFKGVCLRWVQPVTAIDELVLCPYPLLIWQYVLLSVSCQIFTVLALSTILTTVSALSKNSVIAFLSGGLILCVSLLLYHFIPGSEVLAGPLALAEPVRYFCQYYVCNLLGLPVLWAVIHVVAWTAISAALLFIANKVYHRKRSVI